MQKGGQVSSLASRASPRRSITHDICHKHLYEHLSKEKKCFRQTFMGNTCFETYHSVKRNTFTVKRIADVECVILNTNLHLKAHIRRSFSRMSRTDHIYSRYLDGAFTPPCDATFTPPAISRLLSLIPHLPAVRACGAEQRLLTGSARGPDPGRLTNPPLAARWGHGH